MEAVVLGHASARPDAVALLCATGQVSYGELGARVEAVARGLAAAGIGRGDTVAVRLPRGEPMVAAMLGALRCGAAYSGIPLDWPDARCADVIRLADVSLCVSEDSLTGCRTVTVDDLVSADGPLPPALPADVGDEPCCVFLTSGSSGEPKAAVAPHRALTRMAHDPVHAFDEHTVTLQSAPPSWDVFALELLMPLMVGGSSLLFEGTHLTAQDIRTASERGANTVAIPAALFAGMVEDDLDCLASIRTLFTGGERGSAKHMSDCLRRFPDLRLVHAYGPVETAIAATAYRVEPGDREAGADVPIGTPVANTTVYVLDDDLQVLPVGEVGQLATAGDGLSLGYLGNESATAQRFRTLPLGTDGEPVLVYLTGDAVRIDHDGQLIFVGRTDRQIKIRGNRVEPAEIERVIGSMPGVSNAVALPLPPDSPTVQWLAACYSGPDTPQPETVREAIRAALPAAFVPDIIQAVDTMPFTGNGKVDWRALAESLRHRWEPTRQEQYTQTTDEFLLAVAEESQVLLGSAPAPDTDLFDFGATSMTAIRLVNRLAKRVARQLSPADVIRLRTPKAIASALEAANPPSTKVYQRTGTPKWPGRRQPARQQLQHWFSDRIAPGSAESLTPVLLRLRGPLQPTRLHAAVRAVVARHEALRTYFPVERGRPQCEIAPPQDLPALLDVAETAKDLAVAMDAAEQFLGRRFHLDREIPIRTQLIPLGEQDHLFACSFHHVGFDGWSLQVFLTDLATAYTTTLSGTTSFIEAARRQDESVDPAERQAAIEYWAGRVTGIEPLPLPRSTKSNVAGPVTQLPIMIDARMVEAAEAAGAAVGGTATALFLAAYAKALLGVLDATSAVVAAPVAGRRSADTDDVIGCFAESMLFAFTEGDPKQLVSDAAEQLTVALSRPTVSQEQLFRKVRSPLTGWLGYGQAQFAVQDSGHVGHGLPGIDVERLYLDEDTSSVALNMELWLGRRTGNFRYRADVVPDDLATRILDRWYAEVEQMITVLTDGRTR